MVAELAVELPAVFPDGPEVFTRLPPGWRGRAVGRVEGLVASSFTVQTHFAQRFYRRWPF
jgi:hypothetical protein